MRRSTSLALSAVLLALFLLGVYAQVWILPSQIKSVTAAFPEVEPLAGPAIVWGVTAIALLQVIDLIVVRLVLRGRDGGLDASATGWLWAIVGCLLAFLLLVVAAFVALNVMEYTTPGVMLGLIGGGILALIAGVPLAVFLRAKATVRHPRPAL